MTKTIDAALAQIQSARATIRNEIGSITTEIERLEKENRAMPGQKASFGEIKKGVIDLVEKAGARYADTHIKASIIDFAKGAYRDTSALHTYGQTLTLGELDAAINGQLWPMANSRFLTGGNAGTAEDLMLYAVITGAVQETLSRVIDTLSPADLGLHHTPSDPEMTRAEMNERIATNQAEIDRLKVRKTTLDGELKKIS